MAKKVKMVADAPTVTVDAKPPRKQYVLRVVEGAKFRAPTDGSVNARLAWYTRLVEYNGKTLEQFVASCVANPPSTPNRGKLTGTLEPVGGWVSFFKGNKKGAQQLLTLEEVEG